MNEIVCWCPGWSVQGVFGCASLLYFPWLSASRLGSKSDYGAGRRPRAAAREEAARRPLRLGFLRGGKVRKTLILLGFLRGLHGAMSKSFRLVVLCLKSCP